MRLVVSLFLGLAFSVSALGVNLCGGEEKISGGDGRPWPWGNEVQFDWKNLQGLWQTTTSDCNSFFVFEIVKDPSDANGDLIVKITQYDPNSCTIVSRGIGYLRDRYLYAQMNRKGQGYNLTVHAFKEADMLVSKSISPLHSATTNGKVALALALFPVGKWSQRASYEIKKLDSVARMACPIR